MDIGHRARGLQPEKPPNLRGGCYIDTRIYTDQTIFEESDVRFLQRYGILSAMKAKFQKRCNNDAHDSKTFGCEAKHRAVT
jgi:hypothetical protein